MAIERARLIRGGDAPTNASRGSTAGTTRSERASWQPAVQGARRRRRGHRPVVAAAAIAVVVPVLANLEKVTIDLMVAQMTMPVSSSSSPQR